MDLRIARLVKAHGLKGGLKVEMYTDEPSKRFVPGAVFALQVPQDSPWRGRSITLRELRWYNTQPVAFFNEIVDRTQAESAARAILTIETDEHRLPDEPDAWYDHQLVGLTVYRGELPIGKVLRVDHLPAQDLIAIQAATGEVLLPFVKAFVPVVDLEGGRIEITPPEGLFELAAEDAATAAGPQGQRDEPTADASTSRS